MNDVHIRAEVEVKLTEDLEKVKQTIRNMIQNPTIETVQREGRCFLAAEAKGRDGLSKLYNLVRQERIRDASRKVLFQGLRGNTITIFLNKQVAFVGHVSFCKPVAESPLGPIKIEITCEDPRALIDWLTPSSTERAASE